MQFQSTLIRIILFLTIQNALAVDDIFSDEKLDFPDTCETGHVTGDWKECASRLSTLIWDAHTWYDNQPISICKIKCTRVLKGHVSKFKWVWDAKFQCEEKAPGIIGKARGFKTRREAMQSAISQTIEQAIMNDKLTANDFKCLFT